MKLVFNPGTTSVVYDNGLMVPPQEWAYVSDDGNQLNRMIEAGKLVVVQVPKQLPAHVDPQAIVPLNDALGDRTAEEQTALAVEREREAAAVRDTDEQSRPKNTRSSKK